MEVQEGGVEGKVGRRRSGEGIFGLHPHRSELCSPVQHLILHLSINYRKEWREACDFIHPVGNALLNRINSRFVLLQRGQMRVT